MRIEVLYPEICNLYGELTNVEYLVKSGAESVETRLKERPKFLDGGIDLVYMGAMTEHSQELAISALMPYKNEIYDSIMDGTVFFITGNALEIFGGEILCEDGRSIPCLGIYDTVARRKMMDRYNAIYVGSYGDMEVVGYKSQFTHTYGGESFAPLFNTERGDGRHPGVTGEGVRLNNFMATYLIGPFLVINPPFTKYLMELCGVDEPKLAFEEEAMDVYRKRLKEFKDPKTRVKY